MIIGEFKSQVDKIWLAFAAGVPVNYFDNKNLQQETKTDLPPPLVIASYCSSSIIFSIFF